MKEDIQYELTPKGQQMAEELSASKTGNLPKLENDKTVGKGSSSAIVLGQIYDLMVKMREDEVSHREKVKSKKTGELVDEEKRNKELLEAIGGKKPFKEAKKKRKATREKKAPGIVKGVISAAVVGAAVSDKTKEEKAAAAKAEPVSAKPPTAPAPAPAAPPPSPKAAPVAKEKEEPAKKISGMDDVKKMVIRHEGVRNKPYKDSLGLWTIGVGHLIGDGKSLPPEWNRTFSDKEVMDLFEQDFAHHVDIAKQTPGYSKANEGGKGAFIDMAFNMGKWWPKWPSTKKKLEEGDFKSASEGLKDSKWYTQVGNRAKEIVALVASAGDSKTSDSVMTTPKSSKLASASQDNKDMKDQIQRDKTAQVANVNKTTNVAQNQQSEQQKQDAVDDRPAYLKKAVA